MTTQLGVLSNPSPLIAHCKAFSVFAFLMILLGPGVAFVGFCFIMNFQMRLRPVKELMFSFPYLYKWAQQQLATHKSLSFLPLSIVLS